MKSFSEWTNILHLYGEEGELPQAPAQPQNPQMPAQPATPAPPTPQAATNPQDDPNQMTPEELKIAGPVKIKFEQFLNTLGPQVFNNPKIKRQLLTVLMNKLQLSDNDVNISKKNWKSNQKQQGQQPQPV